MAATAQGRASDDAMPPDSAVLELHVAELRQLFNAMDPAPFRERDLDPNAVAYIVEWARETRAGQPLGLIVQLGREPSTPGDASSVRIHRRMRHRRRRE